MGSCFINTGDNLPFSVPENRMYFIPIMKWIVHPLYGINLAETSQQCLHLCLLFLQLLFIRNIQILAAAASVRNRTETVFSDHSCFRLCKLSSCSFRLPWLSSSSFLTRLPGLSLHPGFFRLPILISGYLSALFSERFCSPFPFRLPGYPGSFFLSCLAFSFAISFKISVFSSVCHI